MRSKSLNGILKEPSVVFNEAAHTYTNGKGELYTGCTTISEAWDKSFFLGPWYAKEAIEAVKAKLGEIALLIKGNGDPRKTPKLAELLDECKGAAKHKSEKAKDDGTAAHEWIESAIAKKIDPKLVRLPMPKSVEAKAAVRAFAGWAKGKDIRWLATEEVVSSGEHKIGGKLDALASIDGIIFLTDVKTSSQLSPSYLLQCAGYDIMLREMGLTVAGYLILRCPKDGSAAETLTITNGEDMKFFRETFLKQREAHRFYVYMQSKFKENGKMRVDKKVENHDTL